MIVKCLHSDEEHFQFLGIEVSMQKVVARVINDADLLGVGVETNSALEFVLSIKELQIMFFMERVGLSH